MHINNESNTFEGNYPTLEDIPDDFIRILGIYHSSRETSRSITPTMSRETSNTDINEFRLHQELMALLDTPSGPASTLGKRERPMTDSESRILMRRTKSGQMTDQAVRETNPAMVDMANIVASTTSSNGDSTVVSEPAGSETSDVKPVTLSQTLEV